MFPDASHFDPNHHLTVDRKLKDLFVNHFAFGHGRLILYNICYHFQIFTNPCRHICPGRLNHSLSWSVENDKCPWKAIGLQGTICGLQLLPYSLSCALIMPKTQTGTGLRSSQSSAPACEYK
jgi:hypothetical protein